MKSLPFPKIQVDVEREEVLLSMHEEKHYTLNSSIRPKGDVYEGELPDRFVDYEGEILSDWLNVMVEKVDLGMFKHFQKKHRSTPNPAYTEYYSTSGTYTTYKSYRTSGSGISWV